MNKLIIVTGPTASGKTQTSIDIALHIQNNLKINTAIVNFDSLLFYQEISIGTAKPTLTEQSGIEHFLINIVSINTPLNAANFVALALSKIKELHEQKKIVILVGGSAFYLRALLKGMYETSTTSLEQKNINQNIYDSEGIQFFINYLNQNDPESILNLHENDHYRLMRAVEFHQSTGGKISQQKKSLDLQSPYDFSTNIHGFDLLNIYLDLPKIDHQKIIEKRTIKMIEMGLLDEVSELLKSGFSQDLKPLQSIGYLESVAYLKGEFQDLSSFIERIVISTRQLAKSQRTFFNKITPKIACHPINDRQKIIELTSEFLKTNS